jgi:hypothetical protein
VEHGVRRPEQRQHRRAPADGPDELAAEVGAAVSADFPDVIAALAARAERVT